jgi:hypothetical protein
MFPRAIISYFQGAQLFKNAFFLFISPQMTASRRYEHLPLSSFQMFSLVVLFGLLHAILFLPLCLSLFGPLPNPDEDEADAMKDMRKELDLQLPSNTSSPSLSHKANGGQKTRL